MLTDGDARTWVSCKEWERNHRRRAREEIPARPVTALAQRRISAGVPARGYSSSLRLAVTPTAAAPAPGQSSLLAFAAARRRRIIGVMAQSKILIADDNLTNVELLEAYLDGLDCEIAVAIDGRDTLDKVATFHPDLILLDIMMPKLSGFEVCKILKRDPNTRQIMILMVTALNESGDIERAVAAGCNDFLSKPVNKLELVIRVENLLKLRHVTDELERLRRYIESMEDDARPGRQRPI